MNLVVGATGVLGQEICRQLCEEGRPVRALVRAGSDVAKVDLLKDLGAKVIYGDLRNRASLEVACQGVDTVITTASAMPFSYEAGNNDIQHVDLVGMKTLIDVAKNAEIDHFIYTSVTGNAGKFDFPLIRAKRAVERYLQGSGMEFTILRPSYFMEVWLSPALGFDALNAKATIYGDGTAPISWIAVPDIARFAIQSLDNPAAHNAVIELGVRRCCRRCRWWQFSSAWEDASLRFNSSPPSNWRRNRPKPLIPCSSRSTVSCASTPPEMASTCVKRCNSSRSRWSA